MTLLSAAVRALARASTPQRLPQTMVGGSYGLFGQAQVGQGQLAQMQAYGQVGWLFAVVSRIAEATAQSQWHLSRQTAAGAMDRITDHPALSLWARPNPFYDGFQFREAAQQHFELVGESWWVLLPLGKASAPVELWPVRPDRMAPIQDRDEFTIGYVYRLGADVIPLTLDDVVFMRRPSPLDPYRGMGVVQSILADLEGERFAALWNRNFFFNSAEPGGIIEVPDGFATQGDFEEFVLRWREQHQGVANAHRVAVLERGHWVDRKFSQRDMQFKDLRGVNRDTILGAFGFPRPMVGITEAVNRANAEAAEVMFGRWLIKPRLERIKAVLNERITPYFAQDLQFDYVSPVPDDLALNLQQAATGFKSGLLSQNEGRRLLGHDDVPAGERFVFEIPGLLPQSVGTGLGPGASAPTSPEANALPSRVGASLRAVELPDSIEQAETTMAAAWSGRLAAERDGIIAHLEQFKASTAAPGPLSAPWRDLVDRLLPLSVSKLEVSDVDSWDWDWWSKYSEQVQAELVTAFEAATRLGTEPALPATQAHQLAVDFARTRAAETLKLDGILSIADTTRQGLRKLVSETIDEGQTVAHLQRVLRDEFLFSKERAYSIAQTETMTALGQGTLQSGLARGHEQKRWHTQGDDLVDANATGATPCLDNEQQGWIPIGDAFASEHMTNPAHMRCRCRILTRITPAAEITVSMARCPNCRKRLPIGSLTGSAVIYCRHCKAGVPMLSAQA